MRLVLGDRAAKEIQRFGPLSPWGCISVSIVIKRAVKPRLSGRGHEAHATGMAFEAHGFLRRSVTETAGQPEKCGVGSGIRLPCPQIKGGTWSC